MKKIAADRNYRLSKKSRLGNLGSPMADKVLDFHYKVKDQRNKLLAASTDGGVHMDRWGEKPVPVDDIIKTAELADEILNLLWPYSHKSKYLGW